MKLNKRGAFKGHSGNKRQRFNNHKLPAYSHGIKAKSSYTEMDIHQDLDNHGNATPAFGAFTHQYEDGTINIDKSISYSSELKEG